MFFIGHRTASAELLPVLERAIEQHITEYNVTDFIVGHYGNFDRLASAAVITAKQKYPDITLSLLIPYHPAERPIKKPKGFDSTYYPPGLENVPRRYAIVSANKYVIDHVNFLIAYAWHPASNARTIVEYAKKREAKGNITVTLLEK